MIRAAWLHVTLTAADKAVIDGSFASELPPPQRGSPTGPARRPMWPARGIQMAYVDNPAIAAIGGGSQQLR